MVTPAFSISVRGLSVGWDSAAPLLDGIHFDLASGERVAIVGPSGCGKTTLLRTLAGLIDPLAGAVMWGDEPIGTQGWPRFRREVMFVQHRPAMVTGTVEANLRRPFAYHTAQAPFPEARAADWLARLGLNRRILKQEARSLSAGEGLRVGLIRAVLCEPKVLLLDEPTGALDDDSRAAVEDLLREQSENAGTAIGIVTHQRAHAETWCDRTIDLAPLVLNARRDA